MKKILPMILSLIMVVLSIPVNAAGGEITVSLDGVPIVFSDAQPFIDGNGRTLVPIGAIAELLRAETEWNGEANIAYIKKEGDTVKITIGDNKIYLNDTEIVMDTAAIIAGDRTFIPLRYVAQALGFAVEWNGAANNVNLITAKNKYSRGQAFDFALLANMPKDKNYMVSPLSLKMALAMAANGADGATKQEIMDALGITDLDEFNKQTADFITNSVKTESMEFNAANSIWHNTDNDSALGFSDTYKSIIKDYFNGTANEINNENGAKTINDWIALQTKNKIKDVVTDDQVKESLSFLVNTIYFKGDWANPFDAWLTRDGTFTDRNGNEKTASFMNDTGSYSYYENDDFQMLAKPYKYYNIQMYFVLPKNDKPITEEAFNTAVNNMESKYVRLKLPKFKTEYMHGNLVDILKGMGVTTAFDQDKADFSNMYAEKPLNNIYISSILQKTFIQVDEEGTEAAAATSMAMAGAALMPEPIAFVCDRPFTYFIRNDKTGDILFMGEYAFVE